MKVERLMDIYEGKVNFFKDGKLVPIIKFGEDVKEIKVKGDVLEIHLHTVDYHTRRYEEFKKEGRCARCGRPNDNGFTECNVCREDKKRSKEDVKQFRISHGLCTGCGKKLDPNEKKANGTPYRRCKSCRDYNNKIYRKHMMNKEDK